MSRPFKSPNSLVSTSANSSFLGREAEGENRFRSSESKFIRDDDRVQSKSLGRMLSKLYFAAAEGNGGATEKDAPACMGTEASREGRAQSRTCYCESKN